MTVEEIIKMFELKPHPEGGFYRETYRCEDFVPTEQLPSRYTLVTGPPTDKNFTRETLEWQVPPELEKSAQEQTVGTSPRPAAAATEEAPIKPEVGRIWSTCIYYLLTPDTFSAMHKLKGDEIYHFYLGDPVEMLNLYANGRSKIVKLGHDIANGATVQHVVPNGIWQGSRLIDGGKFALMGTTMSPGFLAKDCEFGSRKKLSQEWTDCADMIAKLTRE